MFDFGLKSVAGKLSVFVGDIFSDKTFFGDKNKIVFRKSNHWSKCREEKEILTQSWT